jgi:hypothetical protein
MTDREVADCLDRALELVEAVSAELHERRSMEREGFKVWGSANLDALGLCRDVRRVQESFAAGLRRRRQTRRGFRERVGLTSARKALAL